jgi:hypothetical protein
MRAAPDIFTHVLHVPTHRFPSGVDLSGSGNFPILGRVAGVIRCVLQADVALPFLWRDERG